MVAKPSPFFIVLNLGYLLAKIHMVAKQTALLINMKKSYLLAKIHMVAKQTLEYKDKKYKLSSSKNPYGSKTVCVIIPISI